MSYYLGAQNALNPQTLFIGDEEKTVLNSPVFNWDYRMRSPRTNRYQTPWYSLWPTSALQGYGDDGVTPLSPLGNGAGESSMFEPWSLGESGAIRYWYFRGQCKDANGNALGGANVQAFRTSDDLFVGQVSCDDKGNYELATPFPSVNHYLVAYYPASPDLAGTTVNTLQPVL